MTQTAKFPCRVIVDAAERQYLKVKWYRDGVELRTGPGTRYTVDSEHSLIISDAAVADTGSFKCGAVTDLDSAEGTAELVVKGTCALGFGTHALKFGVFCCLKY